MQTHLRIARPVTDLKRAKTMYCEGLGLRVIGSFADHAGFGGVMLGRADLQYHFEFTVCRAHPAVLASRAFAKAVAGLAAGEPEISIYEATKMVR